MPKAGAMPTTPATLARRRHTRAAPGALDRRDARLPGAPAPKDPPVWIHTNPPPTPTSTPLDFNVMAAVTDHRDADLLENLARLTELRDQLQLADRRGVTAYTRTLKAVCHECVALEDVIASTPAFTSEGRRAKALHALRDADPDAPCGGFTGISATAHSALWDIIQAGAL